MKKQNKTCKKDCNKACCKCNKPKDTDVNAIVRELVEEGRKKVVACSEAACKAGEVLKYLLQTVKTAKDAHDNLVKLLQKNGDKLSGIKVDLSGDVAKFGVDVKEEKFDSCEFLFRTLVAKSKFDFTGFEVAGSRVPNLDKEDKLAFRIEVTARVEMGQGCTKVDTEMALVYITPNMDESIKAFDDAIDTFTVCKPRLKQPCNNECKKPITLKPAVKPAAEPKKTYRPPTIKELKEFLLKNSKYAIPPTRMQVVADKVDRKSQKYVYELRFYQKSYKSVPADKRSYEPVAFRLRMRGDRSGLIADRFDKAVGGLKFNTFPKKK